MQLFRFNCSVRKHGAVWLNYFVTQKRQMPKLSVSLTYITVDLNLGFTERFPGVLGWQLGFHVLLFFNILHYGKMCAV